MVFYIFLFSLIPFLLLHYFLRYKYFLIINFDIQYFYFFCFYIFVRFIYGIETELICKAWISDIPWCVSETKSRPGIKMISDRAGLSLIEISYFILRVFNLFGKHANWIERHDREFKKYHRTMASWRAVPRINQRCVWILLSQKK